jgi:1-acyl-sn-glycerol-3-phosphate acyltransferase
MSDAFYKFVRFLGRPAFYLSASPIVLHADRLRNLSGAVIIAPNHLSPYDVPCLMAHAPRPLDFVSIVEVFRNPFVARFLGGMNAFPLDRSRVDPGTTRKILDRLERGRTITMFPEGRIRTAATSVLGGAPFNPSVTRLARLANVPIVPCVLLGTGAYARAAAWLPLRRTRYALSFGEPFRVDPTGDEKAACAQAATRLREAYDALYAELQAASGLSVTDSPWRREAVRQDARATG